MPTKKSKNQTEGEEPVEEEIVLTAEDQRKIEHGKWLGSISKKAKKDKLRREIMEEEFSYLPYILYPLAGISTFALVVMMFTRRSYNEHTQSKVREEPETPPKTEPKKKKYETLG